MAHRPHTSTPVLLYGYRPYICALIYGNLHDSRHPAAILVQQFLPLVGLVDGL